MSALLVSLTLLLVGYLALAKGPTLLAATVMTAVCRRALAQGRVLGDALEALSSPNLTRLRDGNGWANEAAEQSLLDRALDAALRRTEIANQYPRSMMRAMA